MFPNPYLLSSGSTGIPKGAVLSDKVFGTTLSRNFRDHDPRVDVAFSFSDRLDCLTVLMKGGRVGCTTGRTQNLYIEIQRLEPSEISAVPRFFNSLFTQYCHTLASRIETEQKKANPRKTEEIEKEVMKEYSLSLGTRMKVITTGGAPTSEIVMNWLKKCFQVRVRESYGTTECGGITGDDNYVLPGVVWKLRDWSEFTKDDQPFPRGELLVKSRESIGRYFQNESATSESFDENGFFQTGIHLSSFYVQRLT